MKFSRKAGDSAWRAVGFSSPGLSQVRSSPCKQTHGCQCTSAPQSHSKNVAFQSHKVAFNERSQVFRADLHLSTHLQPLHCKLGLVLAQRAAPASIRDGNSPAYPGCAARKHQPSVQCCSKPQCQTSANSLGTGEGEYLMQKGLRTFAFSVCMNTPQHHSAHSVRELQDNEAKFKLGMVYWYTVLGFIAAFSAFMAGCVSLQSIHRFDLSWHQWKPVRAVISLVQLINILILSRLLQRL